MSDLGLGGIPQVSGRYRGSIRLFLLFKNRIFVGYVSDTYPAVSAKYPYPIRYPTRVREFCEVSAFHRPTALSANTFQIKHIHPSKSNMSPTFSLTLQANSKE